MQSMSNRKQASTSSREAQVDKVDRVFEQCIPEADLWPPEVDLLHIPLGHVRSMSFPG
jgi:hypothetical protein